MSQPILPSDVSFSRILHISECIAALPKQLKGFLVSPDQFICQRSSCYPKELTSFQKFPSVGWQDLTNILRKMQTALERSRLWRSLECPFVHWVLRLFAHQGVDRNTRKTRGRFQMDERAHTLCSILQEKACFPFLWNSLELSAVNFVANLEG